MDDCMKGDWKRQLVVFVYGDSNPELQKALCDYIMLQNKSK
jgi:hypothetical protein